MAARKSFNLKTLSIRLERDPAVESLLPAAPQNHDHDDNQRHQVGDKNSSPSDCFICGRSGLRNSEDLSQHREEKEYFKSILINPQLRSRMSSKDYAKFQENLTTCVTCLAIIEKVWAFQKKMTAIQLDLDELVEEARQKTVKAISQDIEKVQKVASSTSSIPVNHEITAKTGKEPKKSKSHPKPTPLVPKIKTEKIKKDEDSDDEMKDVKIKKKEESEDDEEITDHDLQHCRNIRRQILSRRLTLRSLTNVRRCGGRKNKKTVPTTSSTSRKTKIKPSIKCKLRNIDAKGEGLSCSKCGQVLPQLSRRIQHELQKCKIQFNTKELEQWKDYIHKCTICGHFADSNATLVRHIQAHKGIKPFTCPRCKKGFTGKWNRNRHCKTNLCFSRFTGRQSKLFIQNWNDRANNTK